MGGVAAAQTPPSPPKSIQDVVDVTVHAPEAAIDDLRGGSIVVHIDNVGRRRISVLRVGAHLSEQEVAAEGEGLGTGDQGDAPVTFEALRSPSCVSPDEAVFPCVVPPGSQAAVPVEVTVHSLARTGKVLVTVEVVVERTPKNGLPKRATLVVVHSLALGIFGEAELSPLLQVPSILVLPGALFLVVLLVLWRVGARPLDAKREEFVVSPSGIEFWLSAVAASLVIGLGWRVFYGRNLLKGYGYRDIGGVLVVAVLLAGIVAGLIRLARMRRVKKEADRRITERDGATVALEKFTKQDESTKLKLPTLLHNGKTVILYTKDDGSGATVVGDPLRYLILREDSQVEEELSDLVGEDKLVPLARRLHQLLSEDKVEVSWGGAAPLTGPKEVATTGSRAAIERKSDD
jgi:uncharacterized membrane protein YedE/YeeE